MNEIVEASLQAMLMGIFLAIIYDCIRFVRFLLKKPAKWFVNFLDVIWFLLYSLFMFLFFMTIGNGVIRLYYIVFSFLGTICYLLSVGRVTVVLFKYIAKALHFILNTLLRPVLKLILFIKQKIAHVFVQLYRKFSKIIEKVKIYLIKRVKILYNHFITKKSKKYAKNLQNTKGSVTYNDIFSRGKERKPIKATVTRKI